jgi:hypothetical protein
MTAARVVAIVLLASIGCTTREDAFYDRVYSCDNNAQQNSCGTTREGKPMTCFAASQLGGDDFCAEACEPAIKSEDPRFTCLSSGALLRNCHPHGGAVDPAWRCPAGLECYRTDLLSDEGLCIQMHVCAEDSDCGEKRPVCAARLVRERNPLLPLKADNLQCVQSMCGAGKAMCPPGEQCLASYYDGVSTPESDICVPHCDGNLRCPPNFACAVSPASSGSPSLCLPGVPGSRCYQDQDCVAGNCIDTGAGFNMCVLPLPCTSNLDCGALSSPAATFLCAEGVPGAGKRCVLREAFTGSLCVDATECPDGFICTALSPVGADQSHGDCRLPCGADGSCPARGGIPHACVGAGLGGCVPTGFGFPCASAADCLAELQCLSVGPDEREQLPLRAVCTVPCGSDADCADNPFIHGGGFCRTDEGVCRFSGPEGSACDRDAQCLTGTCAIDASGAGRCAR